MKKRYFLTSLLPLAAILLTLFTATNGCSKDNQDMNPPQDTIVAYITQGNATGAQLVPPLTTSATGKLTGTFYSDTRQWVFDVNWTGLSGTATGFEMHGPADVGMNAPLLFSLPPASDGVSGSITLSKEQATDFLQGKYYFVVTTAAHPDGEIRGQVYPLKR